MQVPSRTSVVPKAAAEEINTISANGTSQNGAALDFDELTDLIRCDIHSVSVIASTAPNPILSFDFPISISTTHSRHLNQLAEWSTRLIL